eukprot:scaffold604_cov384-Prasinococcus_capsulatus_cf.AAC.47
MHKQLSLVLALYVRSPARSVGGAPCSTTTGPTVEPRDAGRPRSAANSGEAQAVQGLAHCADGAVAACRSSRRGACQPLVRGPGRDQTSPRRGWADDPPPGPELGVIHRGSTTGVSRVSG